MLKNVKTQSYLKKVTVPKGGTETAPEAKKQ
jgi:hypothetical protein